MVVGLSKGVHGIECRWLSLGLTVDRCLFIGLSKYVHDCRWMSMGPSMDVHGTLDGLGLSMDVHGTHCRWISMGVDGYHRMSMVSDGCPRAVADIYRLYNIYIYIYALWRLATFMDFHGGLSMGARTCPRSPHCYRWPSILPVASLCTLGIYLYCPWMGGCLF